MTAYRIFIILVSFIPALINIGIFIYAFYYLRRDKLVTTFALINITSAVWQISDSLLRFVDSIEIATHIYKVLSFGTIFLLPASVHFSLLYTNKFNKSKASFILTLLYLPAIFFYFLNSLGIDKGHLVLTKLWYYSYVPAGTIDLLNNVWLGCLGIYTIVLLFNYCVKIKKTDSITYKSAYLIAIGYLIPAVMGIITQLIFPLVLNLPELPLTTTFITCFSLASIYSLRKYKLFDYTPFSVGDQVVDYLNESIIITDNEDIIRYVNQSFYTNFGYQEHELLANPKAKLLVNIENLSQFTKNDLNYKNLLNRNIELKIYHKNGEKKDVLINQYPFVNHRNKKVGTISLILDITILKDKENELLKSEKKLLLSQKIAGIGFLFWNLQTNEIKLSNVTRSIFGIDGSIKYLTPTLINEVIYIEDRQLVKEALQKAIANKQVYNIEHRLINQTTKKISWVRAQGELYFEEENETPTEFIGTIIDITQSKNAEKNQLVAMLSGEEKEKKRIAFELHDGIAQYLAAINMTLIGIKDDIPESIIEYFNKAQQLVAQTLNETRNISHNLIPKEMELGLEIALNHLAVLYKEKAPFNVHINFTNVDETKIPQFTRFNLYRISQEFVNNAFKYAKASTITIDFISKKNKLFFTLMDDGIGFKIDKITKGGIGIKNITQRVKAFDGLLNMESTPEKGTRFEIILDKV